ncbi:hypothetical protein ACS5PN_25635 [Roseateles sp. NT4]|uniref:hypothetical protein n=1 Tax=Roseateles sp. NT4 TaxID=3453715 RepID=UPI003EEC3A55
MKRRCKQGLGVALVLGATACLAQSQFAGPNPGQPQSRGELKQGARQEVRAAFDARFDAEGRAVELRRHDEAEYPASFWAALESRLAGLKVPPARDANGRPAALRTGLTVTVAVTRGAQDLQLRITNLDVSPLVLKRGYAGFPTDIGLSTGWTGEVDAECVVGLDGHCGSVHVKSLPGVPASVLRWASATLAQWEFQPPELNGQAFEAPARQHFQLGSADDMPMDFRQRGSGNMKFRWDVKTF